MIHRKVAVLAFSAAILLAAGASSAEGPDKSSRPEKKKVLVELYTSQGCDSCPPANDFLGHLSALGYGPERVVLVAFHVDYFNDPWPDPFSDALYSRRQLSYNSVKGRDDLYFTPMMMIDGRYPMLGSDQPKALAALAKASKERPGVSLAIAPREVEGRPSLTVELEARSPDVAGRELLIGFAVTEGPLTTKVASGENAGKTLVEHAVVRSFAYKMVRLERSETKTLTFPLNPATGPVAARRRAAVFVQDRFNGTVYQADSVSLETPSRGQ